MTEPMRQPLPGDLGLAPGGGVAMAIVRWGTGTARLNHGRFWRHPALYGHAALCVGQAGPTHVLIVEATPNRGVIERPVLITHFDWSTGGELTAQYDSGVADRERAVEIMRSLKGQGYDWPNIARAMAAWAVPAFYGAEDRDNRKVMCSEATTWALRGAGATAGVLGEKRPAGRIVPNTCGRLMAFYPKTDPKRYGL